MYKVFRNLPMISFMDDQRNTSLNISVQLKDIVIVHNLSLERKAIEANNHTFIKR